MLNKACSGCGEIKPATKEFFVPNKACRNGITGRCKVCTNAGSRAWKTANKDRLAPKRRADYARRYGPIHRQRELERQRAKPFLCRAEILADGVRERSRRSAWPVPVEFRTKKYFMVWLLRQPNCECCGVKFRIEIEPEQKGKLSPRAPSLDRFDTSLPYTLENTALICWRCNNIKRDYTSSDLRVVADWMDRRGTSPIKVRAA